MKHTFLFDDGDAGLVFMNPENYEQVHLTREMVGDAADYLRRKWRSISPCTMARRSRSNCRRASSLRSLNTEPVVKGQTASSSYKPAKLANGLKTMVPPHIGAGTRVVISTEDGSYVERAKD